MKLGNVTTSTYDAEGRLVKVTYPDGSVAAYQYDANGNLTRVTDGLNHAWQFAFDSVNRLTTSHRPRRSSGDLPVRCLQSGDPEGDPQGRDHHLRLQCRRRDSPR